MGFQHTAARRRLRALHIGSDFIARVSTHSRTKAAASRRPVEADELDCFNTQPHEGGCQLIKKPLSKPCRVSTHSRAEAAAARVLCHFFALILFQHTAARRRLHERCSDFDYVLEVSTHSRAKAAALLRCFNFRLYGCFNTQPREGGCCITVFVLAASG